MLQRWIKRLALACLLLVCGAAWSGKNTPPTVSLLSPPNGATYTEGSTITLSATASDSDGTVTKVEFFWGSTFIGAVTAAPYTYYWKQQWGPGSFSVTAKATDNGGATATSAAAVITVTKPPASVSITSPASGASVGTTVDVSGTLTGNFETSILVFNGAGSTVVGSADGDHTFHAQGVPLVPGSNTISVTAVQRDGATATTSSTVTVPYLLSVLTSPTKNAIYDSPTSLTLQASVLSATGNVQLVEYYDGSTLLGTATTPPYTFVWQNPPKASHSLVAKVTDDAGFSASSTPVAVTVAGPNAPPTVSLTAPAEGASYLSPATVTMQATAADSDGTIARVDFLQNGTVVGSSNAAPYQLTRSGIGNGSYVLTARAVDNRGGEATSAPVNITVRSPAPVAIVSPSIGANLLSFSPIPLTVAVQGQAYGVKFYTQNGATNTLVGEAASAPYTYVWSTRTAGTYTFVASALVQVNGTPTDVWSDPVTVTVANNPNGQIVYLHPDLAGSVIGATDVDGNLIWREDYRPYGERLVRADASAINRQFYAGRALDGETGLSYMGARYYDPAVARFMGIDPILFKQENLQSFNRYAYGNNNPYRFVDPDGAEPKEACTAQYFAPPAQMKAWVPGEQQRANSAQWQQAANTSDALLTGVVGSVGPSAVKAILQTTKAATAVQILEREGNLVIASFKVGKGEARVAAEMIRQDNSLILRGAHIEGDATLKEAMAAAKAFGREQGVKSVVIEGGVRTTGANPGHIPRPITISTGL